MIHDEDTLAFARKERPGCQMRNVGEIPLASAGKAAKINAENSGQTTPEDEALQFYFLQHAMHDLGQKYSDDEPLGDALPVVHKYHQALNSIGTRMFHYILITTTREMRHLTGYQEDKLNSKHGNKLVQFTKQVKAHSQSALYGYSGDIKVGDYLDYLCEVYDTLSWSSAYGGKNWGNVARCLRECVHGETSIEMMLDTAFTLAHNNGPIFNKGFQYSMYDGKSLGTILDCQRAGQIPNLIKAGDSFCKRIGSGHKKLAVWTEGLLGKSYQKWVDWEVVEALGAMHSYEGFKNKNKQLFSGDPDYVEANKEAIALAKAAAEAAALKKALDEKTKLEIMPGVFAKKAEKTR